MANQFNAQGSFTVRRLRNGDTLYIMLEAKPGLFQAVNKQLENNNVTPDWTVEANQPTITPKCYASRSGITPILSNHKWTYNGLELQFGSVGSDNWCQCTNDSRFKMYVKKSNPQSTDPADGALKIVGNLASNTNPANDTITYNATASVDGVEYQIQRSIDVIIHEAGASSYNGWITADDINLTAEKEETMLTTNLIHGITDVKEYYVEWSKYNVGVIKTEAVTAYNSALKIDRSMVDDTAIFIAKFYENSTAYTNNKENPLCMASIRIDDIADDYEIIFNTDGDAVGEGKPVTVTAWLRNATTGKKVEPDGAVWGTQILHPETLAVIAESASNSIKVTTAHTDTDGTQHDVVVVSEVSW